MNCTYCDNEHLEKTSANTRAWYLRKRDELLENTNGDKSEVVHKFDDGWTIRRLITSGDHHYEGNMMENCIKGYGYHVTCKTCKGLGGLTDCKTCKGTRQIRHLCRSNNTRLQNWCDDCGGYRQHHSYPVACKDCANQNPKTCETCRGTGFNWSGKPRHQWNRLPWTGIHSLRDPDNISMASFLIQDKDGVLKYSGVVGRGNTVIKPEHAHRLLQFTHAQLRKRDTPNEVKFQELSKDIWDKKEVQRRIDQGTEIPDLLYYGTGKYRYDPDNIYQFYADPKDLANHIRSLRLTNPPVGSYGYKGSRAYRITKEKAKELVSHPILGITHSKGFTSHYYQGGEEIPWDEWKELRGFDRQPKKAHNIGEAHDHDVPRPNCKSCGKPMFKTKMRGPWCLDCDEDPPIPDEVMKMFKGEPRRESRPCKRCGDPCYFNPQGGWWFHNSPEQQKDHSADVEEQGFGENLEDFQEWNKEVHSDLVEHVMDHWRGANLIEDEDDARAELEANPLYYLEQFHHHLHNTKAYPNQDWHKHGSDVDFEQWESDAADEKTDLVNHICDHVRHRYPNGKAPAGAVAVSTSDGISYIETPESEVVPDREWFNSLPMFALEALHKDNHRQDDERLEPWHKHGSVEHEHWCYCDHQLDSHKEDEDTGLFPCNECNNCEHFYAYWPNYKSVTAAHSKAWYERKTEAVKQLTNHDDKSELIHAFDDGWSIRRLKTVADGIREGVLMNNCIKNVGSSYCYNCDYHGRVCDSRGCNSFGTTPYNCGHKGVVCPKCLGTHAFLNKQAPMENDIEDHLRYEMNVADVYNNRGSEGVFSLRDPDNFPHASFKAGHPIEFAIERKNPKSFRAWYIYGRSNTHPTPQYSDRIESWVKETRAADKEAGCKYCLAHPKGKYIEKHAGDDKIKLRDLLGIHPKCPNCDKRNNVPSPTGRYCMNCGEHFEKKSTFQKEAPYGIPKEKGGDNADNDSKMERCVQDVMAKGHDKESAIRICKTSLGFTKEQKEAANTRAWYNRKAEGLNKILGPDTSETVHNFDNGWSIKKLKTIGDSIREGVLMENCIKNAGSGSCAHWTDCFCDEGHLPTKEATRTKSWWLRESDRIADRVGTPDTSPVLHTFDDGWTVRQVSTKGEAWREGVLMNNCIKNHGGQLCDNCYGLGKVCFNCGKGECKDWGLKPPGDEGYTRYNAPCQKCDAIGHIPYNGEGAMQLASNLQQDHKKTYSLRDQDNIPQVTFRVDHVNSHGGWEPNSPITVTMEKARNNGAVDIFRPDCRPRLNEFQDIMRGEHIGDECQPCTAWRGKTFKQAGNTSSHYQRKKEELENLIGHNDQSEIVHQFPDDWTIRALKTSGDAFLEGQLMDNCIKDHGSMQCDTCRGYGAHCEECSAKDAENCNLPPGIHKCSPEKHMVPWKSYNCVRNEDVEHTPNECPDCMGYGEICGNPDTDISHENIHSLRDPNNIPYVSFRVLPGMIDDDVYDAPEINEEQGRGNTPVKPEHQDYLSDHQEELQHRFLTDYEQAVLPHVSKNNQEFVGRFKHLLNHLDENHGYPPDDYAVDNLDDARYRRTQLRGAREEHDFLHETESNHEHPLVKHPGEGQLPLFEANKTRAWYDKKSNQIAERVGPDTSEVVHEFPNGWTIRKLKTTNDAYREGNLMPNCIRAFPYDRGDECSDCNGVGGHFNEKNKFSTCKTCEGYRTEPTFNVLLNVEAAAYNIHSLRDERNIPHVSFNLGLYRTHWYQNTDKYESIEPPIPVLDNVYGRGDEEIKPQHKPMLQDFLTKVRKQQGITKEQVAKYPRREHRTIIGSDLDRFVERAPYTKYKSNIIPVLGMGDDLVHWSHPSESGTKCGLKQFGRAEGQTVNCQRCKNMGYLEEAWQRKASDSPEWLRYGKAVVNSMAAVLEDMDANTHSVALETADYWLALGLTLALKNPDAAQHILKMAQLDDSEDSEMVDDARAFAEEVLDG